MATLHQVLSAMQGLVSTALSGVTSERGSLNIMVGVEWPAMKTLQQNVKGGTALVSIFDRKRAADSTRWIPRLQSITQTYPNLMSSMTSPRTPTTVYIGGTIQAGDAVSVVARQVPVRGYSPRSGAACTTVSADSTLDSIASALAAAINADPIMSLYVSATASGATVVIDAVSGAPPVTLYTNVGSTGSQVIEVGRRNRELQITVWAAYEEDRMAVGDAIESLLAGIEVFAGQFAAGVTMSDGTTGRLTMVNDYYLDDAVLSGALRRDFVCRLDYPVTNTDVLYSVIAPVMQYKL